MNQEQPEISPEYPGKKPERAGKRPERNRKRPEQAGTIPPSVPFCDVSCLSWFPPLRPRRLDTHAPVRSALSYENASAFVGLRAIGVRCGRHFQGWYLHVSEAGEF